MMLVLCDEADRSALWAMEALKSRGHSPMMLTGAQLASAVRWQHTVSTTVTECEIHLPSTYIRGWNTRGVLNRLPYVPSAWQRRIGGPDRCYALQEMYAFYLSWLHSLPGRKLNPPTPQGLCGNWRHPSVWTALAHQAGLPVRPFRQTSNDDPASVWEQSHCCTGGTLYVVGSRVVGPAALARPFEAACKRLAELAETPLLGISFMRDFNDTWKMTRVSIMPDLVSGGEALAEALAEELAS
jgi:hypothetical protein